MVRIASESKSNYMTAKNLAIVFGINNILPFSLYELLICFVINNILGPGLIRPQTETLATSMFMPVAHSTIEALIDHYQTIFKEERPKEMTKLPEKLTVLLSIIVYYIIYYIVYYYLLLCKWIVFNK
jgi:hypothetical protein